MAYLDPYLDWLEAKRWNVQALRFHRKCPTILRFQGLPGGPRPALEILSLPLRYLFPGLTEIARLRHIHLEPIQPHSNVVEDILISSKRQAL